MAEPLATAQVPAAGGWRAERCRHQHHHRVPATRASWTGATVALGSDGRTGCPVSRSFLRLARHGRHAGRCERRIDQGSRKARERAGHRQERLERAYGWLEEELAGQAWAAGEGFTLADCAAAPSLFYADWVYQIPEIYPVLRAYRARLLARPSFARAVNEARRFRPLFPLGAPDRD